MAVPSCLYIITLYNMYESRRVRTYCYWWRIVGGQDSDPFTFNVLKVVAQAAKRVVCIVVQHDRHRCFLPGFGFGLQGKLSGDTFIVLDAYALPVEGTETRVNAHSEANEYMVDFGETSKVRSAPWLLDLMTCGS